MITLRPFDIDHIKNLNDPENEPGLNRILPIEYWKRIEDGGMAFSAFADGEFLGCGGYGQPWPGIAQVWVWETSGVHRYPQGVHRLVRRALQHIEQDKNVWRISCEVRKGNERGRRWVELLGFQYEGTMEKYGPDGSDFMLYAKVTH